MTADEIVRAELDADPLARGYAGMTDAEVCADLNTAYRDSWERVSASDILEIIVPAAWSGLTNTERADVDSVLSMGTSLDFSPGSRARVLLTTAFAGSPATLNALEAVAKRAISRAEELNCGVTEYIVTAARRLE